jgi:putative PEP-CTERM system histidine kinase
MTVLEVTHLVCAAAFASLAALIAIGKPSRRAGIEALVACILTTLWAAMVGFSGFGFAGAIPILESLRTLSWLVFVSSLLLPGGRPRLTSLGGMWLALGWGLALTVLAGDIAHFVASPTQVYLTGAQVLGRIALGVLGVLSVENFYRNSTEEKRWSVAPICVGLGGIFVFELVVYADAFLLRRLDTGLFATRAIAGALAVPFIGLAMVRNRNWRIDIHVSRTVVFHSATFIASGIFLLSVATVGTFLRAYAGEWGVVAQLSLILGGVLVLAMAVLSGGMRSRVKRLVVENFFSHRYDYRAEWMKFIGRLSHGETGDLQERVIRAVADIVDSPAGVLWLLSDATYRPAATWNMRHAEAAKEPADSPFIAGFGSGDQIQRVKEVLSGPSAPAWLRPPLPGWLVVPLQHEARLIGFILLAEPRAPFAIDWEVLQLLRIVGRQSASYLSEAEATRALADAKLLEDYSKRFAFVVHDVKNLVSQLSLVLSNAEKFKNNPAFQQDALLTIRSSVDRMNKLLQQLGSTRAAGSGSAGADVEQVIRSVLADTGSTGRVPIAVSGSGPRAAIDPAALSSVLTHLVNNALEASGPDGAVKILVEYASERVTVDVCDQGPGMEPSFIRNELFRPLRSTKTSGYGIGAFQSRELVRSVGGDLDVLSSPGAGTTMRIILPLAKQQLQALQAHAVSAA